MAPSRSPRWSTAYPPSWMRTVGRASSRRRLPMPRIPATVSARLPSGSASAVSSPSETTTAVGAKPSMVVSTSSSAARYSRVLRAGGERHVDGRAEPRAAAQLPRVPRRVGVEAIGVAVERHVQHLGVLPEDLLGAVAVVDVEVEDHDPAVGRQRSSGDGRGVQQAEPPVGTHTGVVPGGPCEGVGEPGTRGDEVRGGQCDVDRDAARLATTRRPAGWRCRSTTSRPHPSVTRGAGRSASSARRRTCRG